MSEQIQSEFRRLNAAISCCVLNDKTLREEDHLLHRCTLNRYTTVTVAHCVGVTEAEASTLLHLRLHEITHRSPTVCVQWPRQVLTLQQHRLFTW